MGRKSPMNDQLRSPEVQELITRQLIIVDVLDDILHTLFWMAETNPRKMKRFQSKLNPLKEVKNETSD